MSFIPHTNNRLEPLSDILCEALGNSRNSGIFEKDYVIVQSRGMEQWLKYQIATKNGIAALIDFPFPEMFLNKFFSSVAGLDSVALNTENSLYRREVMTWSIMDELPGLLAEDMESGRGLFNDISRYLDVERTKSIEPDSKKLLQLSEKIAEIFYRYLAYRPDCLLFWEGCGDFSHSIASDFRTNSWQRILWRKVSERLGGCHIPRLIYDKMKDGITREEIQRLPSRVFVFGISSMPPLHLEIFSELSKYIDVHFFYRNICRDNWEYNLSEKETFRFLSNCENCENIVMPDTKNELLASMAKREREFFRLMVSNGIVDYDSLENASAAAEFSDQNTLLTSIQNDVLRMTETGTEKPVNGTDDSIQIHSFHSPMREIESLHDYLLKFIDESEGKIKSNDIIVMAPDIESYTPYIEAVFESGKRDNKYIYSTISDRTVKDVNLEAEAFLRILKTVKSRFKVTEVFSLLSVKALCSKFGFHENDLSYVHKWLDECAVNWGVDEKNREAILHTDSTFYENSWKAGLDKMMLGYAMTGSSAGVVESLYTDSDKNKILPYEEIEGSSAEILGKFIAFTETLFALGTMLSEKKSPEKWKNDLVETVDSFFSKGENLDEGIEILYYSINSMFDDIKNAGFEKEIDLEIIIAYLENHLQEKIKPVHFLRGGISFCRFTPMRSIPSKIICMIGMNEDDFPGKNPKIGFDLMLNNRRSCDPSPKDENRYVFLEGILSATDKLYISYIGHSISDNSEKLPSILVTELKEYIDKHYIQTNSTDISVSSALTLEHPLHPFSPGYFQESRTDCKNIRLLSYSKEYCNAAKLVTALMEKKTFRFDFLRKLPEVADESLKVEDLVKFYKNPSRYLLNTKLGIELNVNLKEELNDREMIDIDGLENFALNRELLTLIEDNSLAQEDLYSDGVLQLLNSKGLIPPGNWGKANAIVNVRDVLTFYSTIKSYIIGGKKTPYRTTLNRDKLEKKRIEAEFLNLYEKGQIFYRFGSERTVDLIEAWIYHVMLSLTDYPGERSTYMISWKKDKAIPVITCFEPLDIIAASGVAQDIIDGYFSGIVFPLKFFPDTSRAYAEKYLKSEDFDEAHNSGVGKWVTGDYYKGDGEDEYFKFCFGEELPIAEKIHNPAMNFFSPLILAKEGGKKT